MKQSVGLMLILLSVTPLYCFGQTQSFVSKKEQYELSERCGKDATEWFKSEWGVSGAVKTKDGVMQASFRNHYNAKRNACIVLLTVDTLDANKRATVHDEILFDLNENHDLGEFLVLNNKAPARCVLGRATCTEKSQWDTLIKTYLEE